MRQLIEKRELLTVSFDQGRDGMTTLLLDADQRRGILIVDASRDETVNRRIATARNVTFSGGPPGKKVRFSSVGAKEVQYRGAPALAIKFPASLVRAQNRDAFRASAQGTFCVLPVPGRGSVRVPVLDLSVGGMLLSLNTTVADQFSLHQKVSGCQLDLGSLGKVSCNIEVRRLKLMPSRMTGMGCYFIGLPGSSEVLISRAVAQQQRKSLL